MDSPTYDQLAKRADQEAKDVELNLEDFVHREEVNGIAIDKFRPGFGDAEQTVSIKWLDDEKTKCQVAVSIIDIDAMIPRHGAIEEMARFNLKKKYGKRHQQPMVPESFAPAMLSLAEGEVRPTISTRFDFDMTTGNVENMDVVLSTTVNKLQLSYEQADQLAADDTEIEGVGKISDYARVANQLEKHLQDSSAPDNGLASADTMARIFSDTANQVTTVYCADRGIELLHRTKIIEKEANTKTATRRREHLDLPTNSLYVGTSNFIPSENRLHARITAPLREYLSLLNMRQVASHLRGEEPHMTKDELFLESVWINSKSWEEQLPKLTRKTNHFLKKEIIELAEMRGVKNPLDSLQLDADIFQQQETLLEVRHQLQEIDVDPQLATLRKELARKDVQKFRNKLYNKVLNIAETIRIPVEEYLPDESLGFLNQIQVLNEIQAFLLEQQKLQTEVNRLKKQVAKIYMKSGRKYSWKHLEDLTNEERRDHLAGLVEQLNSENRNQAYQ